MGMVKWTKTYALAAILALGMLGCFATRTAAQQDGKMTGTIIDFDGNPWANLPVKIKSDVGATTRIEDGCRREICVCGPEEREIHVHRATSADAGPIPMSPLRCVEQILHQST